MMRRYYRRRLNDAHSGIDLMVTFLAAVASGSRRSSEVRGKLLDALTTVGKIHLQRSIPTLSNGVLFYDL